jgi:hypothetical protein
MGGQKDSAFGIKKTNSYPTEYFADKYEYEQIKEYPKKRNGQ